MTDIDTENNKLVYRCYFGKHAQAFIRKTDGVCFIELPVDVLRPICK